MHVPGRAVGLVQLPPELRNRIYALVVCEHANWIKQAPAATTAVMALSQVSRSVRAEAVGLYFSQIPIFCWLQPRSMINRSMVQEAREWRKWLRTWGQLAVPSFRRLTLRMPGDNRSVHIDLRNLGKPHVRVHCPSNRPGVTKEQASEIEAFVLAVLLPDGRIKMTPDRLQALLATLGDCFYVTRSGKTVPDISKYLNLKRFRVESD